MNSSTALIIRSFLRITAFPILIFCASAWLIIRFMEPIDYLQGDLHYPEDPRIDLLSGSKLTLFYLLFTPVLLLNFIESIYRNKYLRTITFLIPALMAFLAFTLCVWHIITCGIGRMFIYTGITAIMSTLIGVWNVVYFSRRVEN